MAPPRKPRPAGSQPKKPKPNRTGAALSTYTDEDLRQAMDNFIAVYNQTAEHRVSVRSIVEAGIRGFLFAKGHWPNKPTWLAEFLARAGEKPD